MLHAVHFLIELCGMMLFIMSNELMLFRFLIFATWILPFAGPLLIGTVANNLVIKDPENKKVKVIICDENLKKIFVERDRVGFPGIAGLMNPHYLK
ncbi:hypothetical protein LOK49_LG05G00378 [Camellia lanceoleosa]|uniref:Uncharacterized protein n=1 Tax=Camellia lanceoleosa TaxID=1840588 RepID=A0ACC0HI16_9ERIC|nr:hypothetical protein LOK49_LG05G00378 [Camellia lanceoleosa]